jgi:segregation and condensation protein A
MEMAEKTVPWWRRALQFALGGIRSGFGLFQRGAKAGEALQGEPGRGVEAAEVEDTTKSVAIEGAAATQENVIERPPPNVIKDEVKDPSQEILLSAAVARMDSENASNLLKNEPASEGIGAAEISHTKAEAGSESPAGQEVVEVAEEPVEVKHVAEETMHEDRNAEPADSETVNEEGPVTPVRPEEVEETHSPEAEAEKPEPSVTQEWPEEGVGEAQESGAAEEASEVKPAQVSGESELAEAAPVETSETDVPNEADDARIEEPLDIERAEELETVEAETTVVVTGANAPGEERVEEVKAAMVPAEEPAASAESATPEVADHEEPVEEKESAVLAGAVEETVSVVPGRAAVEEVDTPASKELSEGQAAEAAEENVAEETAVEARAAELEAENPANDEASSTPAAAESEAKAEPEVEATTEAESVVGAAAEAVAAPAQMELIPKPPVDEKAAAKLAEQQRRRKEAEEESPFSVMVDHVYDGPLDLLLDLIRKQDIDIYDIPIAKITAQFLAYVNQLKASDVDVAGEFIYTASLLIHIKSKMLLPRTAERPGEAAEDPRRELVERLLEHERFKNAAQMLQQKQMMEAASWSNPGYREFVDDEGAEPEIAADTVDLVRVFREILERARNRPVLDVEEDTVTVGQMIRFLGRRLTMEDKPIALRKLLSHTRSERALIAMFLALLELVRLQAVLLRQDRQFSEIFVKKHASFDTVMNEGLANARDDWR